MPTTTQTEKPLWWKRPRVILAWWSGARRHNLDKRAWKHAQATILETIKEALRGTDMENATWSEGVSLLFAFMAHAITTTNDLRGQQAAPDGRGILVTMKTDEIRRCGEAWTSLCMEAARRRKESHDGMDALSLYLIAVSDDVIYQARGGASTTRGLPWRPYSLPECLEADNFCPGEGLDLAREKLKTWITSQDTPQRLKPLMGAKNDAAMNERIRNLVLETSPVAGNPRWASYLFAELGVLGAAERVFSNPHFSEECYREIASQYIDLAIANKDIAAFGNTLTVSWPAEGAPLFFSLAFQRGWTISDKTLKQINLSVGQRHERPTEWAALIGDAVNTSDLQPFLFNGASVTRLTRMLPVAAGGAWTAILEQLLAAEIVGWGQAGEALVQALQRSGARNVAGCKHKSLLDLVGHKDKNVRYEGIRLAGMRASSRQ